MINVLIGILMISFFFSGVLAGLFYLIFDIESYYNYMVYAFITSGICTMIFGGIMAYINSLGLMEEPIT